MESYKRAFQVMEQMERRIKPPTVIERTAPDPDPEEWREEAEAIKQLATSGNPGDVDEAIRRSRKLQRIFTMPARPPRGQRPRCTATTRKGDPCKAPAYWPKGEPAPRNGKCHIHGGLSTGLATEEGKQAIAESNRQRARASGGA